MYRTLLRHLRRTRTAGGNGGAQNVSVNSLPQNPNYAIPVRAYAFSSAEEAAAERRRRKRRLRIEPPMWALRRDPASHSQPGGNPSRPQGPPLPDGTSALTGPRLNLHNRVQSLIRAGDLDSASAVARQAVFSKVRPTVFTCNAIIAAMYRGGRHTDSISLFQYFFNQSSIIPNIVSYNYLILAHFGNGDVDSAIGTYHQILEVAPFSPSCFTYRNLTKGLIEAGRIDDAVDMLREMLNKGQGADSLVYNNLISGFLELGNLERATELFDELQERCTVFDGVVSATFMDWYFKQGKKKEAMEAYRYLLSKQFRMVPATCNVLLEVLVRHGMEKDAWSLFSDMLDNHTPPTFQAVNSDTFNIMVNECFRLGKVSEAIDVFKRVGKGAKSRPFAMDVAGFNNIIARLCEVDMFEEAEGYLAQLQSKSLSPDVTSYRTFIDAYVRAEKVEEALEKYKDMVVAGLRVIPCYANKWFSFLIEKGKVTDCLPILMKMCDREPKPDVSTFEVVIRGLCEMSELDGCSYAVAQMMHYGVGLTPGLKQYLLDVFEKQGKLETIQNIVDFKFRPSQMQPPEWFVALKSPPNDGHLSLFPPGPPRPLKKDAAAAGQPAGQRMPWQAPSSTQFPRSGGPTQTLWQSQVSSSVPQAASIGTSHLPSQSSSNAQVSGASQWQRPVSNPSPGQGSVGASHIPWQVSSTADPYPKASSQVSWQNSASSQFPGQASPASQMPPQSSYGAPSSNAFQEPWHASVSPQMPQNSSSSSYSWGQSAGFSQKQWQTSPPSMPGQAVASSTIPSPGASQPSWQPSNPSWQPSVSPQAPPYSSISSHSGGQSTGFPQTSWQTSHLRMSEQAATPPHMSDDSTWRNEQH
ncbi:OLC1v1001109C1 [Oldenlandia corymbosa var. corymbosa]|uniref:OLC1v1001109C1 n=1 Tax=Oldenlandia corymbosa var. corymbosa TaxID=529605 RepID=A0AAV1D812_OLDCO|nr:OLC1v1001109C1 [Oldenlandia corymbosa var. corymbosa]